MNEVPSQGHGPRVLIGDVARGVAVVSLLGEHDMATANDVRNTLVTLLHTGAGVVVDLTETTFVDCSIMHVLDESQRFPSQDGARLSIQLATRPIVRRVFELLSALSEWPIHGTRADAIRAVSRASHQEITDVGLDLPEERESDLDRDLMTGIARGDRNAFLRMFDRYAPTAMGLAWRMLRHRHLAEEAVQETFLAVWRDPDGYRAERGTVRAWLMSTVHHRAVDLIRHEASQNRRAMESAAEISTAGGPADPGHVVVEEIGLAEDRKAVRRALDDLNPEQRQIIELMYFDGLSQTRIAERLPLPLGTVKSRARLAMRLLAASLGGMERSGNWDDHMGATT